jgi:hypothetical protein
MAIKGIGEISRSLEKIGLPGRDLYEIPTSEKRFPDGSQYRYEISLVERLSTVEAVIDEMKKRPNAKVHRLICCNLGTAYLTDDELRGMARAAAKEELGVVLAPGPNKDVGASQKYTSEGSMQGNRYRGIDQLAFIIAEIKRCIDLGFRGFLVIDEGEMWALNELRKIGEIPKDTKFKWSTLTGHGHPAAVKLLESLGADTINPRADLTLPILAAIRKVIDVPLDIFVSNPESFGGFNRFWEVPEIIRVSSPCYFKVENGSSDADFGSPHADQAFVAYLAREKVRYTEVIQGIIEKYYPEAKTSEKGTEDTIPVA